jgi:diaminobutyrate-2-oxoglutarate transaminase
VPDAIIMSKALGGGFPLALVAYHKRYDKWNPGSHSGTFRGNQIALVAGAASMKYIRENNLQSQAMLQGEILRNGLRAIARRYDCIAEIRGRGLMMGAEVVTPEKTRSIEEKNSLDGKLARLIKIECFKRGLILETGGRHGAVLRFLPPLVITKVEIDSVIDILDSAIASVLAEYIASPIKKIA